MATTWHGILVVVALFGCQPSRTHESLRYPEHRKLEEHRLDELEATTPNLVERIGSLEKQVAALKTTVSELEQKLTEQKPAEP